MKRQNKTVFRIVAAVGAVLLIAAFLYASAPYRKAGKAAAGLPVITEALGSMLPEKRTHEIPSSLPSMPIRVYDGEDYIALLEFPVNGVALPVCAQYVREKAEACPFRECGSAYDGDLTIGGICAKGQFDFFDRVDIGDTVLLTDMRGREFVCEIMTVIHAKKIDAENYRERGAVLTIYSYKPYTSNYLVILCRQKTGVMPDNSSE